MYYFIVNPKSKSSKGRDIWSDIHSELEMRQFSYKVFFTQYRGHAEKLATQITEAHPDCTLVGVGGDGTIHELLSGIRNVTTITFGYIPTGSGNDFARGMGISADTLTALRHILEPKQFRQMDLGIVTRGTKKSRFGVSTGIGFDAGICHEALASNIKKMLNKIGLGSLTYALIAAKQIFLYEPCPMTIRMDGNRRIALNRSYFAAVMNQPFEGGGLKLCPGAKNDDKYLNVCLVGDMPRFKILFLLPTAFWGKHTHLKGVHMLRCKSISIHMGKEKPVHLDGESGGIHQNLSASIEPDSLRVIVN
ncbi:MAG: diacylglycerol kinase family lipid kinase [Lachnospiraceae bacterium]|nr:diacylglycerol kinase family lipid kinase [Lachnospiraceae bacterium]